MPLPSNAKLSPHFTAAELRADDPTASSGVVANLKRTADYLEVVRETLGVPLQVTSGYRSPARNADVGGSATSSHQDGLAADFVPLGARTMYEYYRALDTAGLPPFDQLIYYPVQGHIHLGLGPAMRREVRIRLHEGAGGTPYLTAANIAALPGFVGDAVASVATNVAGSVSAAASRGTFTLPNVAGPLVVVGVLALLLLVA